jgi:hypothetical protein
MFVPNYRAIGGREMARFLVWISSRDFTGWTCKRCNWSHSISQQQIPLSYRVSDELQQEFDRHDCAEHPRLSRQHSAGQ